MPHRKAFVFTHCLREYTKGLAVARAFDKQHAIRLLVKQFDFYQRENEIYARHQKKQSSFDWPPNPRQDHIRQRILTQFERELQAWEEDKKRRLERGIPYCDFGTCHNLTREKFIQELQAADCLEVPDEQSFGVFVCGGS